MFLDLLISCSLISFIVSGVFMFLLHLFLVFHFSHVLSFCVFFSLTKQLPIQTTCNLIRCLVLLSHLGFLSVSRGASLGFYFGYRPESMNEKQQNNRDRKSKKYKATHGHMDPASK